MTIVDLPAFEGDAAPKPLDWDLDRERERRREYLSPSLATFQAYERPLMLKRGSMQYLYDEQGKEYLDLIAQNVCISVGHSHPVVNEAVRKQMDELVHCTTMWMHPSAAALGEELIAKMPDGSDWVVHLVNSGAEAIDLAMLMARAHTGSTDLIALRRAYHGLHFGAATLSGLASCHQPTVAAPGSHHVSPPDQYRGIYGPDLDPYLAELNATIESSTDGTLAGFIYEPIQGFGGVTPLPAEYIDRAAERVRDSGGLIIADEVQTGFGRTGVNFWGFEIAATVPDIVVMAKGIGNGFPLAAVVSRREVAESITGSKFFNTYGSNPTVCAAGRAVLSVIDSEELQQNSAEVGGQLRDGLRETAASFEFIGDVRGRGLMLGLDIVTDASSREPAPAVAAAIHEGLRDEGLILSRSGAYGNVLRLLPPMCIGREDVERVTNGLKKVCAGIDPEQITGASA